MNPYYFDLSHDYTRLRSEAKRFQNKTDYFSFEQFEIVEQKILFEFGLILGVNLEKYPKFFSYVLEALISNLPSEWSEYYDIYGRIYYKNNRMGRKYNRHPLDEHYKKVILEEKHRVKSIKRSIFC